MCIVFHSLTLADYRYLCVLKFNFKNKSILIEVGSW